MINGLTFSEEETCYTLMQQTDEQLQYTLQTFTEEATYNSVDYLFISRNRYAFPVQVDYLVTAVLNELAFRGLLE